jgi:hypothetical protein
MLASDAREVNDGRASKPTYTALSSLSGRIILIQVKFRALHLLKAERKTKRRAQRRRSLYRSSPEK